MTTPQERLEILVRNAHSKSPDHVKAYCLGVGGQMSPGLTRRFTYLKDGHPFYDYCIPWDDQTGDRLQDMIDARMDEVLWPNLAYWCQWGIDAWTAWQEGKKS